MRLALLFAAAVSLSAVCAAAAPVEPSRTFKTWLAVCDNGLRCNAYGFGPDTGVSGYVRLSIDAGPDAHVAVAVGGTSSDDPSPVTLTVSGGPRPASFGPYPEGKDEDEVAVPPRDTAVLVAALKDATSLTLRSKGGQTAVLPLAGAAAALLWIDDRQGRVATTTALARPGPRPASSVPRAPPLPVVAAAGQATALGAKLPSALAARADVKQCKADNSPAFKPEGWRLSPALQLWLVPCGSGAYNFTSAIYATDGQGRAPRPVDLPTPPGSAAPGARSTSQLVNADFDPKTMILSAFDKGRGLSDCGDAISYAWTGGAFALTESSAMDRCQGLGSDHWPTYFRARVVGPARR